MKVRDDAPHLVVDNTSRCGRLVDPALLAAIHPHPLGRTPDRVLARHEASLEKVQAAAAERTVVVDEVRNRPIPTDAFTGYITIYCCRGDPGGQYCGLTASGAQVAKGMVACSPHWPFGTRFIIRGDTSFPDGRVCEDRGSAVTASNHLDVFFHDCGDQQDPAPGTGWAWLAQVGTEALVEVIQ